MRSLASFLAPAVLISSLALAPAASGGAAAPQPAPPSLIAPAPAAANGVTDRVFEASPTLATEVRLTINALENIHFNRNAVTVDNYKDVIPDFMGDLDTQRLFFFSTDKTGFATKYDSQSLYQNLRIRGDLRPAFDMFNVYSKRASARITWVFDELKKDFDFTTDETYQIDRSKAEWPRNAAEADDLWRRRLKSELLVELLGQKPVKLVDSPAATPAPLNAPAASVAAPPAVDPKAKALADAKEVLRKRYERVLRNIGELDVGDVSEMFLTAIAGLYDPHSNFFSADSLEDFAITMKLKLTGIGAVLESKDDYCIVKEIVVGGPADLSGQIHPEDKIVGVAQAGEKEPVDITGMRLRKIVEMIRGEKDTKVRLIIQPAGASDPSVRKEVVISRDLVKLNSARAHGAIFQVPGEGGTTVPLGVITLPVFYGDDDEKGVRVTSDVAALIKKLQAGGVKGIVLDLRHNGGGYLNEAIDLTGLFIKQGPVVQIKQYDGSIHVDEDDDPGVAYGGPLAVLVDRFSASASEIVAGALQNYGRAVLIGDSSTHGKGSVQTILDMKERLQLPPSEKTGAIKLTIQKFYLPNGSSTQLRGVVPDIVLPSIDDFIPNIGESDLPHALIWDDIKSTPFDGKPLDQGILSPLLAASRSRQAGLPEFSYVNRNIEWYKTLQAQKAISLNLATREKQKESDDAFRKAMKAEHDALAKNDFAFEEVRLVPPPPAKVKAPAAADDGLGDPADDELSTDATDPYPRVDIPLRESLRVVEDYLSTLSKIAPAAATTATARAKSG